MFSLKETFKPELTEDSTLIAIGAAFSAFTGLTFLAAGFSFFASLIIGLSRLLLCSVLNECLTVVISFSFVHGFVYHRLFNMKPIFYRKII